MTTYLTKTEGGKIHHFRATVEQQGVNTVQGVFYNQIKKRFSHFDSNELAIARHDQLVDEKLKEGFRITGFKETPENTTEIYDKASWHYEGDFPADLDEYHGYIHTGMFVGWLVENDLMNDEFQSSFKEEAAAFKKEKLTGTQLYKSCCDGILMLDDLCEPGNRFALHYFEFYTGKYLIDYDAVLVTGLSSMYHVADTWDNYKKLRVVIDKRFAEWKAVQA